MKVAGFVVGAIIAIAPENANAGYIDSESTNDSFGQYLKDAADFRSGVGLGLSFEGAFRIMGFDSGIPWSQL
jgi:hypothetical protein